jgi:hypothetical protein
MTTSYLKTDVEPTSETSRIPVSNIAYFRQWTMSSVILVQWDKAYINKNVLTKYVYLLSRPNRGKVLTLVVRLSPRGLGFNPKRICVG